MDQILLRDEGGSQVFAPDFITASQHRDQVCPERIDQPEIRLMLAVMEDAVATYQRCAGDPRRAHQTDLAEVEGWIDSTDRDWPYSFENVCAALDFEPEALRLGLRTWRRSLEGPAGDRVRSSFRRVNGKRHTISIRDRSAERRAS